jgi:hypothetical protein
MSWSIEEHIGEGRPWPEQVVVYRGETDESLTYARRSLSDVNKMVELMDTLAAENAKLREQGERLFDKTLELLAENARLRELCADLYAEMLTYSTAPNYNASVWAPKLRELGVEVNG